MFETFEPKALEDFLKGKIAICCDSLEEMIAFQAIIDEKGVLWRNGRSAKSMSIYPHDAYRINSEGFLCATIARYGRKHAVNYSAVFPDIIFKTPEIPEVLKNAIEEVWYDSKKCNNQEEM